MKMIDNRDDMGGLAVYTIVLTLFAMAILATLGEGLAKVLWAGFGLSFLQVIIWSIANRRYRRR